MPAPASPSPWPRRLPILVILGAALIGAGLMLVADFGARMAGFPYELPLGLFASLIGAPWLVWLMMRSQR